MKSFFNWALVSVLLWVVGEGASAEPTPEEYKASETTPTAGDDAAAPTVRLEFRDQEWLSVLTWLAEQRGLNLDWQELPEGTLNLSSAASYSLDEAHDLINMQLLARGYTTLAQGEVLRVAKLENLDPTLVPRVAPEDLAELPPHQFVRISFPLNWMIAEEAAAEFAPLLSPHGQLHPMSSTNRLEVLDAVINLRELERLLTRAEADEERRERVVEFPLEHRRAEEIAPKVRLLLGLPPTESTTKTLTALDLEKTRFRSAAVKELGASAKPLLTDEPSIHLVVNEEENSILVHARSDKIEIARQAIAALDKPLAPQESPWKSASRMKTYDVEGFDATTVTRLVEALREDGKLDKDTRIDFEAQYNRLIVFGSPDDQLAIATLLQSFKTETRRAEVLTLITLDPHYAARAVETVLKNPTRPSATPGAASDGKFQIEPDARNSRLLLWATPSEVAEVRTFLQQLGETADGAAMQQQLHVLPTRGVDVAAVEEELREVWQRVSDAPLIIERPTASPAPEQRAAPSAEPSSTPKKEPTSAQSDRSVGIPTAKARTILVADQQPPETKTETEDAGEPSPEPVRLIMGKDGKLVIASDNPQAAAAAKALLEGLLPAGDAVRVVRLEHADAQEIQGQLSTILNQAEPNTSSSTLSLEPQVSVEVDDRTNSLIIQHASDTQARLIDKMLPVLDAPTPKDQDLERVQRVYQVRFANAQEIAETLKEVYRDLLSKSDKTFQSNNRHDALGYSSATAKVKEPQYQGLLSISSDPESNQLIVSAPAYLMDEVLDLVQRLDTGPADSTIGVVQLSPGMNSEAIMKALSGVLEERRRRDR